MGPLEWSFHWSFEWGFEWGFGDPGSQVLELRATARAACGPRRPCSPFTPANPNPRFGRRDPGRPPPVETLGVMSQVAATVGDVESPSAAPAAIPGKEVRHVLAHLAGLLDTNLRTDDALPHLQVVAGHLRIPAGDVVACTQRLSPIEGHLVGVIVDDLSRRHPDIEFRSLYMKAPTWHRVDLGR